VKCLIITVPQENGECNGLTGLEGVRNDGRAARAPQAALDSPSRFRRPRKHYRIGSRGGMLGAMTQTIPHPADKLMGI